MTSSAGRGRRLAEWLGPRPEGAPPNTVLPLLAAAFAWILVNLAWDAAFGGFERARLGAPAQAALYKGRECVVALLFLGAATRGTMRPTSSIARRVAIGVVGGVAMFAAQIVIGLAINAAYALSGGSLPEQAVVTEARAARGVNLALIVVTAVALAPFAEEIFFRGLLLPAAARILGERKALVVQAAIFGLIHFAGAWNAWPLAIPLAFVGWCNGATYLRTGSLAVPILMHATFNAVNLLALNAR